MNQHHKIYLSKSKVGNPDELMLVRHLLFQLDCEVLEFMGGTYTGEEIKKSDILIVLPPSRDNIIGKGQYSEVDEYYDLEHIYIVEAISISDKYIRLEDFNFIEETNGDWAKDYGKIHGGNTTYNLANFAKGYDIPFKKEIAKPMISAIKIIRS